MTNSSFWSEPEWVTADIIQGIFNECQYFEKVRDGRLSQHVLGYDNHLNRRQRVKASEPKCTRSQIRLYTTQDGQPVALVHQYTRRNGEIGGCGSPDPKRLFQSGRIIAVRESP